MNRSEFDQLVATFVDALNRREYVAAASVFAADVQYADPPRYAFTNRDDLLAFFVADGGYPQRTVAHTVIFDETQQTGAVEYTYEGTHRYHGTALVRVGDGKITHWREYQNLESAVAPAQLREHFVDHHHGDYTITTDPTRLDLMAIHAYLSRSYWSRSIPLETVARAMRGSLCFGLFCQEAQVGFARVITDGATFAYLCDVYILEAHRGQGLSKWLLEVVMAHPKLHDLRRFVLVTRDAHALYEQLGFESLSRPETYMEIDRAEAYEGTDG